MALDKELIDKLLEGYQKPEDLIGENGLLKQLTKALVERALNAELTHHLGYEKNDPEGRGSRRGRERSSNLLRQGTRRYPDDVPSARAAIALTRANRRHGVRGTISDRVPRRVVCKDASRRAD